MKTQVRNALLLATATLSLAGQLSAQPSPPMVGPRPPGPGDERVINSPAQGYLRVFTPDIHVFDAVSEDFIWKTSNYRVRPVSGGKARTWFHGRALELDPGVYVVEISDDNYNAKIRVSIKRDRITSLWLNDAERPAFAADHPALVRDTYGDLIGYRAR